MSPAMHVPAAHVRPSAPFVTITVRPRSGRRPVTLIFLHVISKSRSHLVAHG